MPETDDRVRALAPPHYAGRVGTVTSIDTASLHLWPIEVRFDNDAPMWGHFREHELVVLGA